jgi:tetratricopeptide (TPR) repeat protein
MSNNNDESNNSVQKLREIEDELDSALDEDSISEMLDGYQLHRPQKSQTSQEPRDADDSETLEVDSAAVIAAAPTSEASEDPPTVEAYFDRASDAQLPEAAVLKRRRRKNANQYPAQPPPLPSSHTGRHRAPSQPPKQSPTPPSAESGRIGVDLRPAHRRPETTWKLDRTSLASVLLELVAKPGVGLLDVCIGKRRAQLVVEDGRIFEVRLLPALAKRSLTALLKRNGKLSAKKAEQIKRGAQQAGIGEAQALLDKPELVSPTVVRSAVCSRTRYLLRRLLTAKLSSAEWYPLDDASMTSMIVSVPLVGILFSHVRSEYSAKSSGKRDRARRGFEGMQLSRKPSFAFSVNQLGLELHERQLIDRVLSKSRRFDKVLKNSPLSEDDTVALLTALEAVGLLQINAPGLREVTRSTWVEDHTSTLERIDVMKARLERENLFAIFGLHWTSYDVEIERNYREISRAFEVTNQPLGLAGDERKRMRDVRESLEARYERLIDTDQRELYRQKLIGDRTRAKAAKTLEALGSAAVRRRELHSALDYYQRLLEIEPKHTDASRLLPVLLARTSSPHK